MPNPYISPKLFRFLSDLEENNNRDWFEENRDRFEGDLREPLLGFIEDFSEHLEKISPHFVADPRKSGGSLFRIFRDVRFSKDKTAYKTNAGIHFRHERAKDAYAPGFYLHLDPKESFVGVGIWHPDAPTAKRGYGNRSWNVQEPGSGRPEAFSESRSHWREIPCRDLPEASTKTIR